LASARLGERRRTQRIASAMPVRVQGFEAQGAAWAEMATTHDMAAGGAGFWLKRSVDLGQVVLLVLPLPQRYRQHDLNAVSYRVYALVRDILRQVDRQRVGVLFLGRHPPRGFREQPAARFLLPTDSPSGVPEVVRPAATGGAEATRSAEPAAGPERREHVRIRKAVNLVLQQVDEWGAVLQEELTTSDDISKGGAELVTTLDVAVGDTLLLQQADSGFFASRAEVRAVTSGADGQGRLHVRFLDHPPPDRLLQEP
jgi:hypothetical protein